jgi:2-methylcitrate dehydratase PrpD
MKEKTIGITNTLVQTISRLRFEDLPQEDVDRTKLVLLDSIGCALAGHVVDRGRLAIALAKELGGSAQATLIGSHRTSYNLAAFANGELINALEYDSIGPLSAHVCPYITPPCLAIAEKVSASGKEFVLSLSLALEIGGRVASSFALHRLPKDVPPYYEDTQRFTYANAVFGGVAGACKLLKLGVEKSLNALGIAGASTPVPAVMKWEETAGPAIMVKYNAWTGWVAQLATMAVLLAEKGFTADTTILDGEWGFWKIVGSPFFDVDHLLGGLGNVWHIKEVIFKPYPICGLNHGGIEAINRIMQEHQIKPEEIEEIVIQADPLLQSPNRSATKIESFADMQFSNAYIFALACYYGSKPSPAWLMPNAFGDPRIEALSKRVNVEMHPRTEELMRSKIKAGRMPLFLDTIAEITTRAGRKFTIETTAPKAMTEMELLEKFRMNASYSMLPSSRVETIIEMTQGLEAVDDITKLTRLLVV